MIFLNASVLLLHCFHGGHAFIFSSNGRRLFSTTGQLADVKLCCLSVKFVDLHCVLFAPFVLPNCGNTAPFSVMVCFCVNVCSFFFLFKSAPGMFIIISRCSWMGEGLVFALVCFSASQFVSWFCWIGCCTYIILQLAGVVVRLLFGIVLWSWGAMAPASPFFKIRAAINICCFVFWM